MLPNNTTSFNNMVLAFYHTQEDSAEVIRKVAASLMECTYFEDGTTVDDYVNASVACPEGSEPGETRVMMEIAAVEFAGPSHEFLHVIVTSIPEIIAVTAVDLGRVLVVPPMGISGSTGYREHIVNRSIRGLVQFIGSEIVDRITAAAELARPDIEFIQA